MPRCTMKLTEGDTSYYFEWSTIVDAPVTFGMSLDEYKSYYKYRYGSVGLRDLEEDVLPHVEVKGCGFYGYSADEIISGNRAGAGETEFTKEQIID